MKIFFKDASIEKYVDSVFDDKKRKERIESLRKGVWFDIIFFVVGIYFTVDCLINDFKFLFLPVLILFIGFFLYDHRRKELIFLETFTRLFKNTNIEKHLSGEKGPLDNS